MSVNQASHPVNLATHDAPWWRGAVIYQIYPRSFRDTSGDGIGDLKGIVEGLDHIASLGVDAVWISPFFTSPMKDFGYDVADYRGIDPSFGTFADFDRIIEKAHGLGLKIIIDQVYSHTSDEHAWFQESRQDRTNPKADWYVWADPKPDGSPPSNWQSVFGGSSWQWDGPRKQYYLHNFLVSQPDLNVHNAEVQDALLDVARFWLDRGVDGFRLDALNFAMHDPQFRDNPPSGRDMLKVTRPFDMQIHVHSQSHPDIPKFLERIRAVFDDYPDKFTVAEVGGPAPLAEMKAFTEGSGRLNSAYNFDFLYADKLDAKLVRQCLEQWPAQQGEGWPSWAFSNHDAPRAVSRWTGPDTREAISRLLAMLLTSLRGNAFIYQGEELGLPQGEVAFEDLQDPEAITNWPHTLGRDGARTPFPWMSKLPFAGFSDSAAWLKPDPAHAKLAVDVQQTDPKSQLNFTRALLALRKTLPALITGSLELLDTPDDIVAFIRETNGARMLCAYNLGTDTVDWQPDMLPGTARIIATPENLAEDAPLPTALPPKSGYWAVLEAHS
ncbi:alpha-glucosidase [Parvularcula marina]|uniref:alpha-glucosidase n=1 Tax=Parvularcula marina TaxID=2292771 RepID=UPI001F36004D|nr:alpha-glucosidase [Parvularcula marina]